MDQIKFYTYVMDEKNTNLSNIQPLIIEADINNTFLEIKKTIEKDIGFPVSKQLLFFNNSVQPDLSRIEQAAPDQAETVDDFALPLFLYLLTVQEIRDMKNTINQVGEEIIGRRIKNTKPLSKTIKVAHHAKNRPKPQIEKPAPMNDGYDWKCAHCTYINDATNLNCAICEKAR